jgi:hypothetical protein
MLSRNIQTIRPDNLYFRNIGSKSSQVQVDEICQRVDENISNDLLEIVAGEITIVMPGIMVRRVDCEASMITIERRISYEATSESIKSNREIVDSRMLVLISKEE